MTDGELLKGIEINKNFFTSEILSLHSKEKIIKKYQEKIEI